MLVLVYIVVVLIISGSSGGMIISFLHGVFSHRRCYYLVDIGCYFGSFPVSSSDFASARFAAALISRIFWLLMQIGTQRSKIRS